MQSAFQPKTMATAVAFALFSASALAAADTVKTEDVKVTATRVEKELSDVNMSVSVITAEDIKHSTARNIGELLKDMVGIEINPDGGQGINRANIRGEDAFRTVVMIDGQKMAEHKSMSGVPMLIDPAMVERIEVIKGPVSVLYGSDAIGGAINIITKKGGEKPFQGTVTGGYNTSADGWSAAASLFGASNGWKYRLTAAAEDNDELDTPAGKMPKTSFSSKSASAFVSYDINPDNTVGVSLDWYDLAFQSSTVELGPRDDFLVDVPKWERAKIALFSESRNVTESLQRIRTDVFYQKSKKDFKNLVKSSVRADELDPELDEGFIGLESEWVDVKTQPGANNVTDQYGFSLQTDWQLSDNHYLIAGYEMSYDKLKADSSTRVDPMPSNLTHPEPGNRIDMMFGPWHPIVFTDDSYNGHQMSNALYASMESLLPHDITLTYGARYTYVNSKMDIKSSKLEGAWYEEERRGPMGHPAGEVVDEADREYADPIHRKSSDGKAVFNAGILWNGIENLTLRANFAQGYRSPILQELYIDSSMGGGNVKANADLKPETSNNFEIGARWSNGSASIDATVFYSDADDYIAKLATGNGNEEKFFNVASAETYGLELTASAYLGDSGFEPYANLTVMKRHFDYGDGKDTSDTGTPLVTAVYGIRWAGETNGMNVRWDAYCRSQSASEYDDVHKGLKEMHFEDIGSMRQWSDNSYKYAGYTTFNLKGGIDFGAAQQYSLDFGLYNVFDKLYQHQGAIYEPGRYAAVKFNAAF